MIEQHNDSRMLTGLRATGGPRDGDGVTIANVSASSPAAREGLKPGDRVVRVGSQPIDDRLDFALAMLDSPLGQPLEISIERSGQRIDLAMVSERVDTEQSIAELAWSVLGIQAQTVPESTMRRLNIRMATKYRGGLYITGIRPGSAADQLGVVSGDVLLGIHDWETTNMKDLAGILMHDDIQRGPKAKFVLARRGQTVVGHVQLAAQEMPSRR